MKKWGPSVLIFLTGLFLGISLGWWQRDANRSNRVKNFAQKLELTVEQEKIVSTILDEKRDKMKALRSATKEEIRKILTPEQLEKYEKMEARWDARRKKRHGPPHS